MNDHTSMSSMIVNENGCGSISSMAVKMDDHMWMPFVIVNVDTHMLKDT